MMGNKPTGIVVHSTAANNTTLKRYVQPVPGQEGFAEIMADLGKNYNANDWNRPSTQIGRQTCVHAFIGINAAGKVETYQVLPWDTCCWGVGAIAYDRYGREVMATSSSFDHWGPSYNYNPQARVQFEICEDSLTSSSYFNAVMKEAQEFCAYLCKKFGFGVDKISSHEESYYEGYGNHHYDITYWLKAFGKDMKWFRSEVQKILGGAGGSTYVLPTTPTTKTKLKVGDIVKIVGNTYYTGKTVPPWVKSMEWVVNSVPASGDRIVLGKSADGKALIMSPFHESDLELVNQPIKEEFDVGDVVKIVGTKYYGSDKTIPAWIKNINWVVERVYANSDRVVINKSADGKYAIMSPVNKNDLQLVKKGK